jgi:fluoride ion exporter CrcB/FEX
MASLRRFEWLLFLACFFAFAFFNQGGGWNQNARFAEVRAIVEQGRFAIDDYLIYKRDPASPGGNELVRLPLQHAEYEWDGARRRLSWVDMAWNLFPVNEAAPEPGVKNSAMVEECNTGDIGYVPWTGHFHPNKPPGTSFLAVPAYWVIYHVERWCGVNPDHWWPLTVNAWLTSVFSVGLISAFGCVIFCRLARELAGGALLPALLATLSFAFGTTFFPFGTLLFDHNLTAIFLLIAFYALWRVRGQERAAASWLLLAGLCAGLAAITNYVAAVAGMFLGLYALLATLPAGGRQRWHWRAALLYSVGVLPPFLLISWYGWVCFDSPFTLNTDFQNPLFKVEGGALGMFALPSAYVAGLISVSPYRGIFFLAPVLLMSLWGLLIWLREKTYAAEARLCLGIFAFFFLVNASFNGYHGGFSAGPRYLVPGLPFLALPLVVAFTRWRRLTGALAVISIVQQTLLTATDAQNSLAVGGHARLDDAHRKDDFWCQIVGDYAWPLFAYGRAWPVLDGLIATRLKEKAAELEAEGVAEAERPGQIKALEEELRGSVARGESVPMILGAIKGPVSVNPIGIYDGLLTFTFFPANSMESDWNSFNAGEFIFPQRRASLLPLLLVTGGLGAWLLRAAARRDRLSVSASSPSL